MSELVIANLGTGNLRSVFNACAKVTESSRICISDEPDRILQAQHLILPGQGAIGTWMRQLGQNPELEEAIRNRLKSGPVLGICLGLQALCQHSDEDGGVDGFGIFGARVRRFEGGMCDADSVRMKVPHMGWNQVRQSADHPLWLKIEDRSRFYFVHSYYVDGGQESYTVGSCEYGVSFTAAAAQDNIFATQFHPEKSHRAGLQLLNNFVNWNGTV
ncbi:MAG: imidazole glycerol phosphate synthase subunit HisH [Pseudomonadota bacterium]